MMIYSGLQHSPSQLFPWAENKPLRKDYAWIKIEAVLYFGVYHLPCLQSSAYISVRISLRLFVRLFEICMDFHFGKQRHLEATESR